MRTRRTMGVFASGCAVYVIMAACTGTVTNNNGSQATSGGGHGASGGHAMGGGGHGGTMTGGGDSGILDALMDPVPHADAEPMSGTRLKGKFRLGADGSKEYRVWLPKTGSLLYDYGPTTLWYDSQRQEDCAAAKAADGKMRCLPTETAPEISNLFTDAQCTNRVWRVPAGQPSCVLPPPKYVHAPDMSAPCQLPDPNHPLYTFRYFLVGALVAKPQTLYQLNLINNTCNLQGGADPTFAYYAVGPEIDPAAFVEFTDGVDP